jgi:hypothetical protein
MCFPRRNALRQIGPQLPRLCLSRRSAGMVDLMSLDPTNAIAPANNRKLTGPAGRFAKMRLFRLRRQGRSMPDYFSQQKWSSPMDPLLLSMF